MATAHAPRVTLFDACQFGEPRAGCVYLVEDAKRALVDAGTAASAPRLLAALEGTSLDYVFLTHVHLDHAGAAGHIAAAHPEATIVVHPRGLPHVADPARLIAAVRSANPRLAPLYGEPLPVDAERIVTLSDGQAFPLGPRSRFVAFETPGHAPHHVVYFEPAAGIAFVGDAVGHHTAPVHVPLTVPPRFDRLASRRTIEHLRALRPRRLAFAHYGLADDADRLLRSYLDAVETWLGWIAELRRTVDEEGVVEAVLADPQCVDLSAVGRDVVRLCVRGALLTLDHEASRRGS